MSLSKICLIAVAFVICVHSVPIPDATVFHHSPSEINDLSELQPSKDLTFHIPESLCANQENNIDSRCVHHCQSKGYEMGLCHEVKCSCI